MEVNGRSETLGNRSFAQAFCGKCFSGRRWWDDTGRQRACDDQLSVLLSLIVSAILVCLPVVGP